MKGCDIMKRKIDFKDIATANRLIKLSCELFRIRIPEIYYIYNRKNDFRLMDENLQTISYDFRSIGFRIDEIEFDPKNYGIYINIDILKERLMGYVVILRKIRTLYQLSQIQKQRKSQRILEDEELIQAWKFAYQYRKKEYVSESPIEMDCNAYTYLIMNYIFDVDVSFKPRDEKVYQQHQERLKKSYSYSRVLELAKKYQIQVEIARLFDLEDFQKEFSKKK